jgi:ribose-phosphate pyrophosphokinase
MDNVEIIDNSGFIKKVLSDIHHTQPTDIEDLILMSSDAGGFKPLMKLCDKLEWKGESLSCSKYRPANGSNEHKLIQQVPREDFEGKDILIVDDISVYGGTFKGLAKLLRKRNCGKLYLAVSHMTVQNLGEDPVTNYFDKVFTTNSKFNAYHSEGIQPSNLKIIKLF